MVAPEGVEGEICGMGEVGRGEEWVGSGMSTGEIIANFAVFVTAFNPGHYSILFYIAFINFFLIFFTIFCMLDLRFSFLL